MLTSTLVVFVASAYLGGLFLLAFISERRARRGAAGFVSSPLVYTLSLAVYCTSWTFYGAVGSAARDGLEYLTIYLGPTLALIGWNFLLRKLVRISKDQHITSIADFISARYGKSASISSLVTIIALVGVTPYIALQLKAVAASFDALGAAQGWETATRAAGDCFPTPASGLPCAWRPSSSCLAPAISAPMNAIPAWSRQSRLNRSSRC